MADSWKTDGDCEECRKLRYCKKQCTKNKQWQEKIIRQGLAKIVPTFPGNYF